MTVTTEAHRTLADLLASEPALPNIPKVVALMVNETSQPEPDLQRLCGWIGTDPVLAAQLLRTANGNPFRLAGRIGSVAQSLAVLGPIHLRSIAHSAATSGVARSVPGIALPAFWRYSLNTAKVARALAGSLRLETATAFSAGLVHALGELVMLTTMPQQQLWPVQKTVSALAPQRARVEQQLLGFCYADVSAGLARAWRWPAPLVDALWQHTHPYEADDLEPLAAILHLAAWRARAREASIMGNALTDSFPYDVAVPLGLDIDLVLQQDPIDWNVRPGSTGWT